MADAPPDEVVGASPGGGLRARGGQTINPSQGEAFAERLLQGARALSGVRWHYGGKDLTRDPGLDCSGFVVEAFRRQGVRLGDPARLTALALWTASEHVLVPEPGDLVFFAWTVHGEDRLHVGIHQGPGRLVGAQGPAAGELRYRPHDWWGRHLLGYGRVAIPIRPDGVPLG
jgi:cell wall-associated NlpC family hydrolase